jgi:hypothetical protein
MSVALASSRSADAQATSAPATSPPAAPVAPPATPHPSPSPKAPSDTAKALAQRMRAYDKNLSDKDIETIARNIDDNLGLGKALQKGASRLKNWDEPAPFFRVNE